MPPEMVLGNPYDYKCDVWSLGIISYMLLTGNKPFKSADREELELEIVKKELKMNDDSFEGISEKAKFAVWKMLKKDPNKRFTINAVLECDWIKKQNADMRNRIGNQERINGIDNFINNIKKFKCKNKMELLILFQVFHSNINLNLPQVKEMNKLFKKIDEDLDGRLSKTDLTNGLSLYIKDKHEVDIIINDLLTIFDDKNNPCPFLSYESFLMICSDKQSYATLKNLQDAFKFFDRKAKAKITVDDLKEILMKGNFGLDFDKYVFENFCKEVGVSADNPIGITKYNQIIKDLAIK